VLYGGVVMSTGKWIYEVLLGSKGVMQIGWCTLKCRFSFEVCLLFFQYIFTTFLTSTMMMSVA